VLGPIRAARFGSAAAVLRPGDRVVLYTDGVVERENTRGDQFGMHRLRACLSAAPAARAAETVAAVLAAVDAFGQGAPVRDDMTVMVARKL
jgi:phosphoserine phosphatase RsbU/P